MAARQGTKLKDHRVLALDIGSRFIKIGELRLARGTISLLNVVVAPTPPDAMDKSQILNPDGLGKELRRLLKENKIATKNVVVAVRSQSSVVVRPIDLPKMSAKELADTMKFEVERHVPFSADEIVMDYAPFVKAEDLPEGEENMRVLLAVAQEELINAYLKVLKVAGLSPIALDVEILSTIRSLVDIHRIDGVPESTVALVNLGAASTDISILQEGNLAFNRSVPIAGDALTNAIMEQLGRTFDEAEELKKEHGQVFLENAIGELPVPAGETDAVLGATSTAPFFSFDDASGTMDATLSWDSNGPLPQQIFSLEDDVDNHMPVNLDNPADVTPSPVPEDATKLFSLDDHEVATAGTASSPINLDEQEEAPAEAPLFSFEATRSNEGPVFDLSSELEQQLPPPRVRPVADAANEPTSEGFLASPVEEPDNAPIEQASTGVVIDPPQPVETPISEVGGGESLIAGTQSAISNPQNEIFQRRIFESIQPTLMELVTEIRRSLEFFSTREPNHPVEKILIYGGTSRLPRLAEFINQEVGLEAIYANPLQMLDTTACRLPAEYLQDLAPVLPVCIGLGLRDMLA